MIGMVSKDQLIGVLLLIGSVAGIAVYGWLVFLTPYSYVVMQVTAFIAILAVLAILAWIGYTSVSYTHLTLPTTERV